ncbi:membralin [Trichonephila inaurata madagascariensis]|uniref:Membralin n=1 Tax=Trichonephila inaurata madagascariensis TaxID=2747483 RepID=A0A8X7CDI9_9ARAC|nr:membralin [Trichonephila inaurata madagascariensis]
MPNQIHPVQQLLIAMDVLPLEGQRFSNNNNPNSVWLLRDRLFQVLFERVTLAYAATFPEKVRKYIERTILILAVISLSILIYTHLTFVRTPVTCLEKEARSWSREGVLRIEISLDESTSKPFNISKFYNHSLAGHFSTIQKERKRFMEQLKLKKAGQRFVLKPPIEEKKGSKVSDPVFINRTWHFKDSVSDPDCFSPITTTLSDTEMIGHQDLIFTQVWHHEKYILEYSLEYGFLRLSPSARQNTSVRVHTIVLNPFTDKCFGNQFSRSLLKYVLGYGDLLMGSLRYLVDKDESKGYVRNVVTGDQYRFIDKNTTWTAYLSAGFFMVVFTMAVSMLLRYSHHQIFLFVVELLNIYETNIICFPAAPLLTVVLALVGMEAIMSEFFNDSVTAFYIILIVWMADQYDSICCRTTVSRKHWLKMFYLYHFGFYSYHYRFNGQYSFLALVTSWLFIQHSMLFFFHRYELPTIWLANEELEYDSDASYNGDNYTLASDGSLIDEDEIYDRQSDEFSLSSQESDSPDVVPPASHIPNNNANYGTRGRDEAMNQENNRRNRSPVNCSLIVT